MRKLAQNIVLSICVGVITLILGVLIFEVVYFLKNESEVSVNWVNPNTEFDSEFGWRMIPNQKIIVPGWGVVSSNSHGFRSDEINPEKKHIVLMGDSVVWGYGMDDPNIATKFLQEELEGTDYQVHNIAVTGYGLGQYYLHLKRNLYKFKKLDHVILVIYAANDINDTRMNTAYGKRKPFFVLEDGSLKIENAHIRKYCLRNLLSQSYFIRRIESKWPRVKMFLSRLVGDKEISYEKVKPVTEKIFQEIERLVRKKEARFSIIISPSVYDLFKSTDGYAWFSEYCRRYSDECLEMKFFMKNNPMIPPMKMFGDPHHYNSKGHRLLANVIYDQILKASHSDLKERLK